MPYSPLLLFHIGDGIAGLLSGAVAMSFRKGSRPHRIAGNVFFVSMLGMSAAGAYMAFMKSEMNNVFGGLLTFYLVATSWVTARRRDRVTHTFDLGALLVASALGACILPYGIEAATSPTGLKEGLPAGVYFFLASVALISAAGDVRMLVRGGISGTPRLVRHPWRMCFAWFIASGSLFIARPKIFPALMRTTHTLVLLGILPLLLMIFWLVRIRFASGPRRNGFPTQAYLLVNSSRRNSCSSRTARRRVCICGSPASWSIRDNKAWPRCSPRRLWVRTAGLVAAGARNSHYYKHPERDWKTS
jgi:uncharacterized membrane protein